MFNKNVFFISGIISVLIFVFPLLSSAQPSSPPSPDCIFSDLAISATELPDPVTAGQNLIYHITATNNGPSLAQAVVITVVLPSAAKFVPAPPASACVENAGIVTCEVGNMAAHSTIGIDLTVHLDPAASGYVNCSMAIENLDPSATDPVPGNDKFSLETFVLGPVLAISIDDTTVFEPDSATKDAIFTVSLSEPTAYEVKVDYATADGTAVVTADYMETHGTLTFPPDITELQIAVPVLADATLMESEETFMVNLSNPIFAVISDPQGIAKITETCLFCDHFDDNVLRLDWAYSKPCWSEGVHHLIGSPCSGRRTSAIANPAFEGLAGAGLVEATLETSGGPGNKLWLLAWYQDKKNTVELIMKEEADAWVLRQKSGGKVVAKKKVRYPIEPNVEYEVEIFCDGYSIQLYVNDELLTEMVYGAQVSGTVGFKTKDAVAKFHMIYVNYDFPY